MKLIKIDPKTYKTKPKPTITYGQVDTKFGRSLVATQNHSLCYFKFFDGAQLPLENLQKLWPRATFHQDNELVSAFTSKLFADDNTGDSGIHVMGTQFEMDVWDALLTIERGSTMSYQGLAAKMGKPTATRAVARAVAKNHVDYFIPCHRVISKSGAIHKYSGGPHRKFQILTDEGAL